MRNRLLIIIASSLIALVAATAARSAAYPPATVAAYKKTCLASAKASSNGKVKTAVLASYCGCTLSYLEGHLTLAQFKAAGQAMVTLSGGTPKAKAAFKGAVSTCKPRLTS